MTREQRRKIEKIDKKIAEAIRQKNFIRHVELMNERNKLLSESQKVKTNTTLKDIMANYSSSDRIEMTTQVIMAVVISDILLSATIDVESKMKKFGISGVPMLSDLREICKKLSDTVHTINAVGSKIFSENYMKIADEVEMKVLNMVKNLVSNELHKNLKTLQNENKERPNNI